MITTGNLYIQVYDSIQNKYIELPFNELSVATYTRSGFAPITGFLFKDSLILNKKLEMSAIDLGKYNKTSGIANNIGMGNIIFAFTGYSPANYSCYNIGNINYLASGFSSFNFGTANKILGCDSSFNIGDGNSISPLKTNFNSYLYTLGNQNIIKSSGDNNYIVGKSNNLNFVFVFSKVIGDGNTINTGENLKLFGDGNLINNSKYIDSFGDANNFYNSSEITSIGDANIIISSTGTFNIAKTTTINNSQNVLVFGNDNTAINGENSLILGKGNSISGSYQTTILGMDNIIASPTDFRSTVLGYYNELDKGVSNTQILGDYNSTSGTTVNLYILGDNNDINSSSNSFVYGSYNILNNSNYLNNIGSNNKFDKSYANSVFGNSNNLSSGLYCTVIGENNFVSGTKNYVFGSNNTVRSGDYNSILIGISHEFTGENKIASITLASIDNSLEISPSSVEIKSANRPKINNENIIITSDLNPYLTPSNGLSNSGIYDSLIISDPTYNRLANQIELQSFAYSGMTDKYYTEFSGGLNSNSNYWMFTGYFRKLRVDEYYQAYAYTPASDYYYQSAQQNFQIMFNKEYQDPVSGSWILIADNFSVLFTNPSTDPEVLPLSNWVTNVEEDIFSLNVVSGNEPAPIFNYNPIPTGIIPKQKINSVNGLSLKNFDILGPKSYATDDIAIIYGTHTDPKFNPAWLIVDRYSSGVYYINPTTFFDVTPQIGWISTGYMNYTGGIPNYNGPKIQNTGIKISLSQTGVVSSYDPTFGKIYIPFYY